MQSIVFPTKVGNKFRRAICILAFALMGLALTPQAEATTTILGSFPVINTAMGVGKVVITPPTSNSKGAWTYSSSNQKIATVIGNTLNILSVGTSTITASQSAIGAFTARARSTQLKVSTGTPLLGAFPARSILITEKSYKLLLPTSNSDGTWSFTSSDPRIASLQGDVVTANEAGIVVITAKQGSTVNWKSATATMNLTVVAITPTVGPFEDIEIKKSSITSFVLANPTSNSSGAWTYSSSNIAVATVSDNLVSIAGIGASIITATQARAGNYSTVKLSMTLRVAGAAPLPSPSSTATPTITPSPTPTPTPTPKPTPTPTPKPTPTPTPKPSPSSTATPTPTSAAGDFANLKITFGTVAPAIVFPVTASVAPWTLKSSNPAVVTFVDTIIQMRGAGVATITATQPATANTGQIKKTFTIEVLPPTVSSALPIIRATASKRVITISISGAVAQVTIDGSPAKIGANAVTPGTHSVVVWITGKAVYTKVFFIQ